MIDYLQRAPFIRILLPFVAGIVTASLFHNLPVWWIVPPLVILFLLILFLIRKVGYFQNIITGGVLTTFFLLAGIIMTIAFNDPVKWPPGEIYEAILLERPVEREKSFRAEILLKSILTDDSQIIVKERMLVYFAKDEKVTSLIPGSRIIYYKTPEEIVNQGNPFEFDYKKYLLRKKIRYQVFLNNNSWEFAGLDSTFRILISAESVRDFLLAIYKSNGLEGDALDVLSALTLGYKKTLDPEIRQIFANTGAAHVLAVSGLHVGIVYLVFNFLFGFMRRRKTTRILFLIMAVSLLWFFAFITGLSPSVQRSALMFTVVLIGENLKRPSNIYNTLALSAFILLVINPNLVFDVGLQLSYAAVTGIVYFQPKLKLLWSPGSKVVRYLWDLLTVSFAAQITTFPLSCYYFNQFPLYFWMSNLIVIPAAFIFICLGIIILVTSPVFQLSGFLASITGYLLKQLLFVLHAIENLPGALITGFNFSAASLTFSFLALLCLMAFIESRRYSFLILTSMTVILFFVSGTVEKVIQNQGIKIIAYKYKVPVIHLIQGRDNYIVASAKTISSDFPDREVKSVTTRLRLKERILIKVESDYSDSLVVKRGNYLFFAGEVIGFQEKSRSIDLDSIDIFIATDNYFIPDPGLKNLYMVSYSPNVNKDVEFQKVHYIQRQGAWCSQIIQRHSLKNIHKRLE
jgi:competence protein ComEC